MMKTFLIKIIIFIAINCLLISIYCKMAAPVAEKYYGPNTAEQITKSFTNAIKETYDCYILGNSRVYRGVNPDLFESVKCFNFAHDNDCNNQIYYKLLYLFKNNKSIKNIIVGTDYFQFSYLASTRNYIYSKYFPKEYLKDFDNKSWFQKTEEYLTQIWFNQQKALVPCIKSIINRPPENVNYLKENGQYIIYSEVDRNEIINRDYKILDIQLEYFRKIITLCEEKDVSLYVVMPPIWSAETKNHTDAERAVFDNMILEELKNTKFKNNYINYSREEGLLPYTDFNDATHLSPKGADKYSEYLYKRIFKNQ